MFRTHVIIVEEEIACTKLRKMSNIFDRKFGHKIIRIDFIESENKMKVFLSDPISFTTIDRLYNTCILEGMRIREVNWKFEKGVNQGTGFLHVKIS